MVLVPKHIIKRLSSYYKVGGFFREGKPPILVLNALDDITHYDYGEPMQTQHSFRKVPAVPKSRKRPLTQQEDI